MTEGLGAKPIFATPTTELGFLELPTATSVLDPTSSVLDVSEHPSYAFASREASLLALPEGVPITYGEAAIRNLILGAGDTLTERERAVVACLRAQELLSIGLSNARSEAVKQHIGGLEVQLRDLDPETYAAALQARRDAFTAHLGKQPTVTAISETESDDTSLR